MLLAQSIESINLGLIDLFGIDTVSGDALFRVVWSEEQFEKRLGTYDDFTPGGLYIRTVTEVRLVPKYRQWIKEKYVLERLVVIPDVNLPELPTQKLSYEPIWVFEDNKGNYLPPRLDAAKFAVDCLYAAIGKKSLAKYVDEEALNDPLGEKRIAKLQEELFGNETDTTDALKWKEGIVVPGNYTEKES